MPCDVLSRPVARLSRGSNRPVYTKGYWHCHALANERSVFHHLASSKSIKKQQHKSVARMGHESKNWHSVSKATSCRRILPARFFTRPLSLSIDPPVLGGEVYRNGACTMCPEYAAATIWAIGYVNKNCGAALNAIQNYPLKRFQHFTISKMIACICLCTW